MESKNQNINSSLESKAKPPVQPLEQNEEYLLRSMARIKADVPNAQFGLFVLGLLICYLIYPYVDLAFLTLWFIGVAVCSLARYYISNQHYTAETIKPAYVKLSCSNAATGVLHSIPLFIPELTTIEHCTITMLYIGTSTVSLNSNAGIKKLYLAYILTLLPATAISWAILLTSQNHNIEGVILFVVMINYILLLISIGKNTNASILNELNLRKEQEELNNKLDTALQEAQQSNESKTRFLASASHDLRQPIHSISLFSAALGMQDLSPKAREITKHITTASQTLSEELDSLLDLSKLDANMVSIAKSTFSLNDKLSKLYNEFSTSALQKGLQLNIESCSLHVHTDRISLLRILRNFVGNAIKYTDQGSVSVRAERINDDIHIHVSDTGIGIEDDKQTKVFEEFYQVNNINRDKRKGIGLGLSIVQRLLKLLDFSVELKSKANEGSTFTLIIPSHSVIDNVEESIIKQTDDKPHIITQKHNHLLVIDDEIEIIKGMEFILSTYEFDVSTATSYDTGLASGLNNKPDLIICDYRLDKNDGIDLIRAIQKQHPGTPAFLVSGETSPEKLRRAHENNIEILHKPVNQKVLIEKIMYYLQH